MPVTSQPASYAPSEFQTGLYDCFGDCSTCCYGFFCFPCLSCSVANAMDECCLCGCNVAIRGVYRTKYNLQGSLCKDFFAYMFCTPCAICQLKRDIDLRKQQRIF
ncbi:Placenta-specific gene 8 protein [Merluccius polli]|uniref:Placenta-specific gene 8 protein n=1 Tax=Merluccius polli TaxID=89951 RepID=A0AA47MQM2_MERPO|nr:Placenta-specific gene 8 protein [Merluccius polli]